MIPKIISIGSAVPEKSYTQREVFELLEYPKHFWPIFAGADIDTRHFWLPLGDARAKSWQEMTQEYEKAALELSIKAARNALDGRDVKEIGAVVFGSCTGYTCASLSYQIAGELKLPQTARHIPIIGDGGCAGAAPVLLEAQSYAKLTGKQALAISVEVCSTCYFPEEPGKPDPRGRYQLLRANAIFGDGASAVLVGEDDDQTHPYILDSESYARYDQYAALGFEWREGRLSVVLSSEVPKLAPTVVGPAVELLLKRWGLETHRIKWLICHPGGKAVLDNIRDRVGFAEQQMELSRAALRQYGNCSSASVGIIGSTLKEHGPQPRDYGLMITVGSGMSAHAILLQWR